MKTPHRNARPTIWFAVVLTASGLVTLAPNSARVAAVESTENAPPTLVAAPLTWHFQLGDTYRIHAETVSLSIDGSDRRYRNETELVYTWRVTDVTPDGTATLVVTPESVKIHSQLPPAKFETTRNDRSIAPTEDPTWRDQFFEAETWVDAEFTCRVNNLGQVIGIWGDVPAAEQYRPIDFTPGNFTQLPGTIVQLGDSWDVAFSQDAGTDGSQIVRAHYRLAHCWCSDDQQMLHIEGWIKGATHSGWLGHQGDFGPMITVSHLNPIQGYFLDQIAVTSGKVRIGTDEIVTVRFSTNRQVTKITEPAMATMTHVPDELDRR